MLSKGRGEQRKRENISPLYKYCSMLTICQVLQHQFYTKRVQEQPCPIITACKCVYMAPIKLFWLIELNSEYVVKYIASFKPVESYR